MASTYTTFLGLEKPGTGEQSGTWGNTVNTNMDMVDQAVDGIISVTLSATGSTGSPNSLPITDGAVSNGRNKYIEFIDSGDIGGTVYVSLTPNDAEKVVHFRNSLSGSRSILMFQGTYNASNDFELLAGKDYVLKFNGGGSGATVTDVNADLAVTALTATTLNGTTVTASGVITGSTVEATGDTSAGDNAAMGYTAAEGLILTGQGSTNDVTIKNDADAAVLQIPTGTVNTTLAGTLGVAGGSTNGVVISQGDIALKNGGTQSTIKFYCESSNAHYAQLQAPAHSSFSGNVTLTLPASTDTLAGIAATQTLTNKTLTTPVLNSPDITGDTAAGDDAALGYTAAEGLILTGQGSTSDVTIKNDADAAALTVPTGTTNVSVVGDLAVGGSITDSGAAVKVAGLETIYVPAAAMYPETTNGCADLEQVELSNGPELKCLDFAAGADDFAQFQVIFPKSWNEGTVTFQAFFTVTGTNTGTVAWGLAGRSFADSADLNTAFGTQVVATAKAHSGTSNDIDVAAVSGAVTIAGAAADTLTIFQIARDVSADSQTGAARLLGIKLFFTTDAANDA